ncbi:MAG: DUF4298 domain-containing protein [Bacilli bacterium]|nr:DUF4298 domain-containing protein [Bacilli bacterium]
MKNEEKRIKKFEKKYLKVNKLLSKLEKDLDNYMIMQKDIQELSDYYDNDWVDDYDNSTIEANILSQDALWDMFELNVNVRKQMKGIIRDDNFR